jgi:transglutaminase-like putative cysteine protease
VDPTNNVVVAEQHVTLGWGRDYSDVSPVRGVILGSGHHTVKVAVDVQPLTAPPEIDHTE